MIGKSNWSLQATSYHFDSWRQILPQNLAPVQLYLTIGSIVNYNDENIGKPGYNLYMDIKTVNNFANTIWAEFCEIYPALVRFDPPAIILNNRFTRTAGQSHQDDNYIQLANKFFIKNEAAMLSIILPHELAHQADFNLFGVSNKKCGHGIKWCEIMVNYGLPANKYHSLEI